MTIWHPDLEPVLSGDLVVHGDVELDLHQAPMAVQPVGQGLCLRTVQTDSPINIVFGEPEKIFSEKEVQTMSNMIQNAKDQVLALPQTSCFPGGN